MDLVTRSVERGPNHSRARWHSFPWKGLGDLFLRFQLSAKKITGKTIAGAVFATTK
ncbi:MAG: hypothetical protein K0Q66_1196 [Chitinophagaceae bacterium]|nr:hypothetical protein [Chitinophagaceae bacterium]